MKAHLDTGPELPALRQTGFYNILRPYLKTRAAELGFGPEFSVRDEDDPKLTPTDRFYFNLEFIFGDIFRNVRTRLWIKTELRQAIAADHVDEVGSHFLYRAYLNELVIMLERLQRLLTLLGKGLDLSGFVTQCEMEVLEFFHPLLSEKRNHNHHTLYLGYPYVDEIQRLLHQGETVAALLRFREVMGEHVAWLEHTEQEFAKFVPNLLDRVHQHLRTKDGYVVPARLPANFRLDTRLDGNLRGRRNHAEIFRQANG